jgi:WD40 repeat protein
LPTPVPSAISLVSLSEDGPWLVYRSDAGLIAVNPDGSGRTLVAEPTHLGIPYYDIDIRTHASPSGGWLALMIFEDPHPDYGPALSLVHLPDGEARSIGPLMSPELEAEHRAGLEILGPAYQAFTAVTMDTFAWSPDGTALAFVSAQDGPSSDLYLYTLSSGELRRLTSGPNQTATPTWSPDGQWIVHQEVVNFGTGDGGKLGAVWAAAADGSKVVRLYEPAQSVEEAFLAWTGPDSLVVYSMILDGSHDARVVHPDTGATETLVGGYFDEIAIDPSSGVLAFTVSDFVASFTDREAGFYLQPVSGEEPQRVEPGDWQRLTWSPETSSFYASGPDGLLSVSPQGESRLQNDCGFVAASADGQHLAVWGIGYWGTVPGVRLYSPTLESEGMPTSEPIDVLLWRLDSQGLFYVADGALYYLTDGGDATWVDVDVQADRYGGIGWVSP